VTKHFPVVLFAILFSPLVILSQTNTLSPKSDVQLWHETQLVFPVVERKDKKGKQYDRLSFFLTGSFRLGQNVQHFVDERIGLGFDIRPNRHITLTPSIFYRSGQPLKNRKEFETRFRFAATFEKTFEKFSLRDRNLIEYRMRNSRSDSTRYRNRLTLSIPVRNANKKELFTPFAADEVFYDFSIKKFSRNEFSAGISKKITKQMTTDFFYLLQNNRGNVLQRVNAFGINLKIKFGNIFKQAEPQN
jgi:hypothetical protein